MPSIVSNKDTLALVFEERLVSQIPWGRPLEDVRLSFQTQRKLPGLPRRETFEKFERYYYHLANHPRFYSVLNDPGLFMVLKLIDKGSQPTISAVFDWLDIRIGDGDVDLFKLYEMQLIYRGKGGELMSTLLSRQQLTPAASQEYSAGVTVENTSTSGPSARRKSSRTVRRASPYRSTAARRSTFASATVIDSRCLESTLRRGHRQLSQAAVGAIATL